MLYDDKILISVIILNLYNSTTSNKLLHYYISKQLIVDIRWDLK